MMTLRQLAVKPLMLEPHERTLAKLDSLTPQRLR